MCLGIFGIVLDAPAQQKRGVIPPIPTLPASMLEALSVGD